jgi:hypothetical protein
MLKCVVRISLATPRRSFRSLVPVETPRAANRCVSSALPPARRYLELVAGLGGKVGDRLLQAFGRLLVELGDADKADVVPFEPERQIRRVRLSGYRV